MNHFDARKISPTIKRLAAVALMFLASRPMESLAETKPSLVCLNSKNGRIVTRTKCKSGETRFSKASYNNGIQSVSNSVTALGNAVNAIPNPARVIHLATSGAPYETIANALAAAYDLNPTSSNPVLVKVAPGTYSLPNTALQIPPFVHLEGSGIGFTNFISTGAIGFVLNDGSLASKFTLTPSSAANSTLILQSISSVTATLEDIAIEGYATGTANGLTAIAVSAGTLHMRRIIVDLEGTTASDTVRALLMTGNSSVEASDFIANLSAASTAQARGVEMTSSSLSIRESSFNLVSTGSGEALPIVIAGASSQLDIRNSKALASSSHGNGVILASEATALTIENSYLESIFSNIASGYGVIVADGGAQMDIRNSTVITSAGKTGISAYGSGSAVRASSTFISAGAGNTSGGGQVTCAGVTDEAYVFSSSTCPS